MIDLFCRIRQKRKHRTEKGICYILGGAPSIKRMDLLEFTDGCIIPTNHAIHHTDLSHINFRYYVLPQPWYLAPGMFGRKDSKEAQKKDALIKRLQEFGKNLTVVSHATNLLTLYQNGIECIPVFRSYYETPYLPMYHATSGALSAGIYLGAYLGFSEIRLLGFEGMISRNQTTSERWLASDASKGSLLTKYRFDYSVDPALLAFFEFMSRHVKILAVGFDIQSDYINVLDYKKDLNLKELPRETHALLPAKLHNLFEYDSDGNAL